MSKNYVITIGRQFGSGGREVALKLAEKLGIKCYDRELIDLAVEKKGMSKDLLEKHDEKKHGLFLGKRGADLPAFDTFGKTVNDRVFLVQSQIIRELAKNESCVIVGRCADYVLRDFDNVLSVFVTAPLDARVDRITRLYHVSPEEAKQQIAHFDKERSSYYKYYTNKHWGCCDHYQMALDSSILGTDETAEWIKDFAERKFQSRD